MSRRMGSSSPGALFTTALTGEVTALGFLRLNFRIYLLGVSSLPEGVHAVPFTENTVG